MSPLLISTVLALAPAAAPPPTAPAAPAPTASVAPAPSAAPMGPVAAPPAVTAASLAPAPAATATSTTTVVPAGTNVTVNVYPPPPPVAAPQPVPAAAPPAVVPAAALAATPNTPDPNLVRQSIRKFRRGAIGLMAIGGAGLGVALASQYGRIASLHNCAQSDPYTDDIEFSGGCSEADDIVGGYYGAIGMTVFVGGFSGAGAMLGKAAAHRDVQLNNGAFRARRGAKILGAASIVAASVWVIGANWMLLQKEGQCDSDECRLKYRPLRFAANDAGALGIAAGAAMVGYGVAYDKQGRALMKLRAAPALTRSTAGISLSGSF